MLRNKFLLTCLLMALAFLACKKNEPYDAEMHLKMDTDSIERFLAKNGLKTSFTKLESGLYYQIVKDGTGATPVLPSTDTLYVGYSGRILGDTTAFDRANILSPAKIMLSNVIKGWQIGLQLPQVKVKGTVRLLIPSPLGYKDFPITSPNIRPNSILDFTIDLVDIKPYIPK